MNPSSIVFLVDNVVLQTHEIPRINIEAFLLISGHIAMLSKTIFMKKEVFFPLWICISESLSDICEYLGIPS